MSISAFYSQHTADDIEYTFLNSYNLLVYDIVFFHSGFCSQVKDKIHFNIYSGPWNDKSKNKFIWKNMDGGNNVVFKRSWKNVQISISAYLKLCNLVDTRAVRLTQGLKWSK